MNIFNVLSLLGGLAMFLMGMNLMGSALEKKAGGRLKRILSQLTTNPLKGFALGLVVTAIMQSSSATTVMVVGFVNSGIMALSHSVGVIMGANVGATITPWILGLTSIQGEQLFIQLLKPSSFTPILAIIGIGFFMFSKNIKKKDTGMILLGFSVLMFGMESMSDAVSGLKDVPQFQSILLLFQNPILGVLAGTVLTVIIQSSSASVGILQALSTTGKITFGSAIPIIMGQNIGTCITAILASIGTTKKAKCSALIHLYFNVIGTVITLLIFYAVNAFAKFAFLSSTVTPWSIALVNTLFKIICVILIAPFSKLLEKLAWVSVKDAKEDEELMVLDTRLMATPSIAVERCRVAACNMAAISINALRMSLSVLNSFDEKTAYDIRDAENKADQYEDKLGTFLVHLCGRGVSRNDSLEATKLLHIIGDFERISDHAVNLLESAEEMKDKQLEFTSIAKNDLKVIFGAVYEVIDLTLNAFTSGDLSVAAQVEPLEQVIDSLRDRIKSGHIERLKRNECSIECGFVLSDILSNLERVSDHCSNIAGCIIEMEHNEMDLHDYTRTLDINESFIEKYNEYLAKYSLPNTNDVN